MLKIGTTNNLERRAKEHNKFYSDYMRDKKGFHYIWHLKLSKYNTVRYEDSNREKFISERIGDFIQNDRFQLYSIPEIISIKVRREYPIPLRESVTNIF